MRVIRSFPCEAELLGGRDYLHSTTILRSLLANVPAMGMRSLRHVSVQFHDLTSRACVFDVLALDGNEALTKLGYVATAKISGDTGDTVIGLRPLENAISQRAVFDEDALADGCILDTDQRCVSLNRAVTSLLETVVSLNKRLHAALFATDGYGKWLLTRLELNEGYFTLSAPTQLRLSLISELASINTKVAIEAEGNRLGFVYFSRKKELA